MSIMQISRVFVFVFISTNLSLVFGQKGDYLRHEQHVLDWIRQTPREVIPQNEDKKPIVVYHVLSLARIVNLDIDHQILELEAWQMISWVDPRLAWDVEPFIQVDKVEVPVGMVWTADVILYNSADLPREFPQNRARLLKNGTVSLLSPLHIRAFCQPPDVVTKGDNVTCNLVFGSWNYDLRAMEIKPLMGEMFLPFYEDFSRDWLMLGSSCQQVLHVNEGRFDFTTVNYSIDIQKK